MYHLVPSANQAADRRDRDIIGSNFKHKASSDTCNNPRPAARRYLYGPLPLTTAYHTCPGLHFRSHPPLLQPEQKSNHPNLPKLVTDHDSRTEPLSQLKSTTQELYYGLYENSTEMHGTRAHELHYSPHHSSG